MKSRIPNPAIAYISGFLGRDIKAYLNDLLKSMQEHEESLSSLKKEKKIIDTLLESTMAHGLDIGVVTILHGNIQAEGLQFVTQNYQLAGRVEIEKIVNDKEKTENYLIHLIHDIPTTMGNIPLFCRDGSEGNSMAYAQKGKWGESPQDMMYERHHLNLEGLAEFYKEKGASKERVAELIEKVQALYRDTQGKVYPFRVFS